MNLEDLAKEVARDLECSMHNILQPPAAMLYCRYAVERMVKYLLNKHPEVLSDTNSTYTLASNINCLKEIFPSVITTRLFKLNDVSKTQLHIDGKVISTKEVEDTIEEITDFFKEVFEISLDRHNQLLSESDYIALDKKYVRQFIDQEGINYSKPWQRGEYDLSVLENALIHIDSIQKRNLELNPNELIEYGIISGKVGRYDKSNNYFRNALERFQSLENYEGVSIALSNLSINACEQGEIKEAFELEEKSLSICIENELYSGWCGSLINLGSYSFETGDYESADRYWSSSLKLSEEIEDDEKQVASLINLGVLCQTCGSIDDADNWFSNAQESIQNYDLDQTSIQRITLMFNIAYNLSERGEFEKAVDCYIECMDLAKKIDHKISVGKCMNNLGEIKIQFEDFVEARELIKESLTIYRETGYRRGEAESLGNLAQIVFFFEDDEELAISLLEDSLHIDRKIGNKHGEAKTLNNLWFIYSEFGDTINARKYERYRNEILDEIELTVDEI